jgi:hypothetical protein
MPIRPELRHLYRSREWRATRQRILERAGGRFDGLGVYLGGAKCERCGAPDREVIAIGADVRGRRYWREIAIYRCWRDESNGSVCDVSITHQRFINVQLGVAHLDHGSDPNAPDEELGALCRYCHLRHDKPQHKETRSTRKDAARPLLSDVQAQP